MAGQKDRFNSHQPTILILPFYTHENPRQWFNLCEKHFFISGISDEAEKFQKLIPSLPFDIITKLPKSLFEPYQPGHYDRLRKALTEDDVIYEQIPNQETQSNLREEKPTPSTVIYEQLPAKSISQYEIPNSEEIFQFTIIDILTTLISLVTYIADIGTDFILLFVFFSNGDIWYGLLTLFFIFLPVIIWSLLTIETESERDVSFARCLCVAYLACGLCCSPYQTIEQYILVLKWGFKQRKNGQDALECSQNVAKHNELAGFLRLNEGFYESAPQLVLQLYIVLVNEHGLALNFQFFSMVISFFSLSWTLVSYIRAIEKDRGIQVSLGYTTIMILWNLPIISSRIIALALFASEFKFWIAIAFLLHWSFMALMVWLLSRNEKMTSRKLAFTLRATDVNIFYPYVWVQFFTRYAEGYVTYYLVSFGVNLILMATFWCNVESDQTAWIGMNIVFGLFLTGILFMLIFLCKTNPDWRKFHSKSLFKA